MPIIPTINTDEYVSGNSAPVEDDADADADNDIVIDEPEKSEEAESEESEKMKFRQKLLNRMQKIPLPMN